MPGAVTTADLYRELVQIRDSLTALVTRGAVADERQATNTADIAELKNRVGLLERAWWKVAGAAAVISVFAGWLTAWFTVRGR